MPNSTEDHRNCCRLLCKLFTDVYFAKKSIKHEIVTSFERSLVKSLHLQETSRFSHLSNMTLLEKEKLILGGSKKCQLTQTTSQASHFQFLLGLKP